VLELFDVLDSVLAFLKERMFPSLTGHLFKIGFAIVLFDPLGDVHQVCAGVPFVFDALPLPV